MPNLGALRGGGMPDMAELEQMMGSGGLGSGGLGSGGPGGPGSFDPPR